MSDELVLVTGSSGLIGRAILPGLASAGLRPIRFDLRATEPAARADLCDPAALRRAMSDATGVVHLGAVSRVVWGENSPAHCWAVNVEATRAIVDLALNARRRPWVIYASSREVYGQQTEFPVPETAPLRPMNIYARSKLAAEEIVLQAREGGLRTAVVRFSSVYGEVDDHIDRVVPAFASAAAQGGTMRVDGAECAFDFTHVDDVAAGLIALCKLVAAGEGKLPPLHYVSGIRTTLRALAEMAAQAGRRGTRIEEAPPRSFDVSSFCGDPARAAEILGWRTSIPLREGLERLIADFAALEDGEHPRMGASKQSPIVVA